MHLKNTTLGAEATVAVGTTAHLPPFPIAPMFNMSCLNIKEELCTGTHQEGLCKLVVPAVACRVAGTLQKRGVADMS